MIYDVIVVGAGPAGSTVAKHLAKSKLSVLLIDKEKFPRIKPCGGGLTPHIWAIHPEILKYIENYTYGGRINVWGEKGVLEYHSRSVIGAYCIRKKMDYALVQESIEAGAKFLENEKVIDVIVQDKCVIVKTDKQEFQCLVVCGADGMNSIVAKKTGLHKKWNFKDVSTCLDVEEEFPEDVIKQYFTEDYVTIWHMGFNNTKGYGYIFPKKNVINIGYGALTPVRDINFKKTMLDYIEYCENNKIIPKFNKKEIKSWIYPICGPLKKIYSNRVLLLGDAAGFVNPLNGEGIHYAMCSGDIAAEVIINSFKNNDFSKKSLKIYREICMMRFGKYLKKCVGIQYQNLKAIKYVVRYAKDSIRIKAGTHNIFKEEYNPRKIGLKTAYYILIELLKTIFHIKKEE